VIFGELVSAYGSYDLPLLPTVFMSVISTLVWLKIDPTEPIVATEPKRGGASA
jgi:ACS family glucarate transporter-like MFS transporter